MAKCLLMPPIHTSPVCWCAGEMEVTQSRSEAAVSDRDPVSQPVHCEWACVLVFCSCETLQALTRCSGRGQMKHQIRSVPHSVSIAGCKRYAVLFRKHISRQGAGKGKAVLECVGLTREQIKLCYQSNPLNEEEAIQMACTSGRRLKVTTARGRTSSKQ